MVTSAGMIWPRLSWVASLYLLTKSMIFTPCWPNMGPTGGAGLALPAGKFSLRTILIFLAICILRNAKGREKEVFRKLFQLAASCLPFDYAQGCNVRGATMEAL